MFTEQIDKKDVDLSEVTEKYDIVLADPPWTYSDKNTRGAARKHYNTMSLREIMDLPVPAKKNSMLFLWGTSPLLPEALQVMEAWNFKYKTSMIWDKLLMGIGHYARIAHEFILIGKRGKFPCPEPSNRFYSVIKEKRTKHSRKPDLNSLIDKMYPDPDLRKIELFAREAARPGWTYWGEEVKETELVLFYKSIQVKT